MSPVDFIRPNFAAFNKEFTKAPFHVPLVKRLFLLNIESLASILNLNMPGSGAAAADDMMVWFRNLGFLEQPEFIAAMGPYAADPILCARIWRVYTLCWAAKSCLALDGDFVDLGCYDGRTVEVMERYCHFRGISKTWWLYDIFDNPPQESRKSAHGPQLFDQVRGTFEPLGNFRVIKGAVPDSFQQGLPDKIAFVQIDLNAAEPELACLGIIHERMTPGGVFVFDDFGFSRYRDSHDGELDYFRKRGEMVWESPTGQGLYIKR